jgi:dTDP-4-amino-4,6-dideoxygalactose transaminase
MSAGRATKLIAPASVTPPPNVATVPLLDINRGNAPLREEILAAVTRVIDSGRFLHGPDVQQLERSIAQMCGVEHAISCASGSDALLLALMALEIKEGDEVIVPSFTFFATASAVWRLGARPVFVDIDPITFNINPQAVEAAVTARTKAIIPVHLFGQCAEMDALLAIARSRGLYLVEDAAQSLGARYRGKQSGSMGDIGCFSFYPTKNLGAFGDGGMIITRNALLAEKLRLLAAHGMSPRYYHRMVGINSRLDTLQAAVLNVKLTRLNQWATQRAANAAHYDRWITGASLQHIIGLPKSNSHCEHVWNQYTIRVPNGRRDDVRSRLAAAGIGAEVYYPVPLHLQECFKELGYGPGSLPETERACREVLSLPIFPELTVDEQQTVVARLRDILLLGRSAA